MMDTNERGAFVTLPLASGHVIDVFPITFGRARLGISDTMDDLVFRDVW